MPPSLQQLNAPMETDLSRIEQLFIAANPALTRDMIAVECKETLDEVRICLDKSLHPRPCGPDTHDRCRGRTRLPAMR